MESWVRYSVAVYAGLLLAGAFVSSGPAVAAHIRPGDVPAALLGDAWDEPSDAPSLRYPAPWPDHPTRRRTAAHDRSLDHNASP